MVSAWQAGVAAERSGAYDAAPAAAVASSHDRAAGPPGDGAAGPPFDLPVLAELPTLAGVLERLQVADHALLDAVAGLVDLLADDAVERTTGVGVEHWLAVVAAQTQMDRRLLVRACRLVRRLPTLNAAVREHRISFAQLRGLTIGLRNLRCDLDGQVDRLLAGLLDGLDGLERPDPDVLVRHLLDAVAELDADELSARERDAACGRFLHLQPRLDGTGGRIVGELDAAGLALLDAATTPPRRLLEGSGSYGAARLDTLLARLAGTCDDPAHHDPAHHDPAHHDPAGRSDPDGTTTATADRMAAAERMAAGDRRAVPDWWGGLQAPKLLVRLPFDALLGGQVPADLLTTLTGGRLRLTSCAAGRLLDAAGADLRTIIVDDHGAVLGVGRASRQPPGWLSDALAAIHDTCTGPGCDRSARCADIDHAAAWWPHHPDAPSGTTDLDNLGPLCAATNRAKESAGWRVHQTINGTRTWIHPRSGLTTTTVPATWRPPHGPRITPRPEPPGPDGPGPGDAAPPLHRHAKHDKDADGPWPF